jgi:hypothetical protein
VNFSFHHRVQNGSRLHPASYPMGTRGSFPGVKQPRREADHSPPSSAEVKECVELYRHSPIRLHGVVLSWKKSTGTTLPLPYPFDKRLGRPHSQSGHSEQKNLYPCRESNTGRPDRSLVSTLSELPRPMLAPSRSVK